MAKRVGKDKGGESHAGQGDGDGAVDEAVAAVEAAADRLEPAPDQAGHEAEPQPPAPHPAPAIPLPPHPCIAHPYPLQENFAGRVRERQLLTRWFCEEGQPLLAIVALGGMGKSALTWVWLQRDVLDLPLPGLAPDPTEAAPNSRVPEAGRPEGVLWWSFYERESTFALFLDKALTYASSGEVDPALCPTAYDKVRVLIDLLEQRRLLLVLDGFERELRAYASLSAAYQGDEVGEDSLGDYRACNEPLAASFLRWAAALTMPSRILLTSRLFPRELDGLAGCQREDLTALEPEHAVAFFHAQGVRGTRAEIVAACQPYGFHPLALRLLSGMILRDPEQPGDVAAAAGYSPLPHLVSREHHVLALAYDALSPEQRELLSRLAAFRSPVAYEVAAMLSPFKGKRDLGLAFQELADRGLVFLDRERWRYDLHPIVRAYAYNRLVDKEGLHHQLRDYFASQLPSGAEPVSSVEDLAPILELYHHMVHAGSYDDAFELFHDRLSDHLYYRLGAYSVEIELLHALFADSESYSTPQWMQEIATTARTVLPRLSTLTARAWTLNALASSFGCTGQLRAAVPLLEMHNTLQEELGDLSSLAVGLENLASVEMELGELRSARWKLEQVIAWDQELREPALEASGWEEMGRLLTYTGAFDEAEGAFEHADEIQGGIGRGQPLGLGWTYRAQRSLLSGRPDLALEMAQAALRQSEEAEASPLGLAPVRDRVWTYWLLARGYLVQRYLPEAGTYLGEALSRCRQINLVELEPDILLAWAEWHSAGGDRAQAWASAEEALATAARCGHRLKQADIHNFMAQWHLDGRNLAEARRQAEAAREQAWCDGPPHCYRPALDEAERLLAACAEAESANGSAWRSGRVERPEVSRPVEPAGEGGVGAADLCDGPAAAPGEGVGRRLANLDKLYHVPVSALRGLLERRVPGRSFAALRRAELVAEAERQAAVTAADVEALYENYRYGRRLSLTLYLLPEGLEDPPLAELQAALEEQAQSAGGSAGGEGEDEEAEVAANRITLIDEERLGDIREVHYRYAVMHRFLNADEQPDQVLQARYGFFWLDLKLGYLAIFARDERVNGLLVRALSKALQAMPLAVQFPRDFLERLLATARAGAPAAAGTRFDQEIEALRPEEAHPDPDPDSVVAGLEVTSSRGKITLSRTLPTSLVRAWGRERLPELVRDMKQRRTSDPRSFSRSIEAINRMRLRVGGKAVMVLLVEALLQADREERSSISLPLSALEIYQALAGKYFGPYLRTPCAECREMAELCPQCHSRTLDTEGQYATCEECGAVLLGEGMVALRCRNGHVTSSPEARAFCIAPNHWLQKRMEQILAELGQHWAEKEDYFYVEGNTLHRLRRGQEPGAALPHAVQMHLTRSWEPVAGQGGRVYGNLDLRLRGSAAVGYTAQLTTPDGASNPPQALLLPAGATFRRQLEGVLRQTTDAQEMREVGRALFSALFAKRNLRLWKRAVGALPEGSGVRIRLDIEPLELIGLPWELIHEAEYVGLRVRFPIVRYLDLPDPPKPLTVQPPLRVLVAVAQPKDAQPLDVRAELNQIHAALAQIPARVKMDVLNPARREDLLTWLRRGYHVLHFVGHGLFQEGQGYLILEDLGGRSDPVSALLLGQIIADSDLRLAVLNACQTSTTGAELAFGGVAHQLVRAGMPAVVAMQQRIMDQTALAFSREFYRALADGWPVDAAVQEGRRSIMTVLGNDWQGRADWAIPTLYMRAPDGVILGFRQAE